MLLKTAMSVIGVDEYEEFQVKQGFITRTFKFMKDGLKWWNGNAWVEDRDVLYEILNKECEVIYKEFIPFENEGYYTYATVHTGNLQSVEIKFFNWEGSFEDNLRLRANCVFDNDVKARFKRNEVLECIMSK